MSRLDLGNSLLRGFLSGRDMSLQRQEIGLRERAQQQAVADRQRQEQANQQIFASIMGGQPIQDFSGLGAASPSMALQAMQAAQQEQIQRVQQMRALEEAQRAASRIQQMNGQIGNLTSARQRDTSGPQDPLWRQYTQTIQRLETERDAIEASVLAQQTGLTPNQAFEALRSTAAPTGVDTRAIEAQTLSKIRELEVAQRRAQERLAVNDLDVEARAEKAALDTAIAQARQAEAQSKAGLGPLDLSSIPSADEISARARVNTKASQDPDYQAAVRSIAQKMPDLPAGRLDEMATAERARFQARRIMADVMAKHPNWGRDRVMAEVQKRIKQEQN